MGRDARLKRCRREARKRNEEIIRRFMDGTSPSEKGLVVGMWEGSAAPRRVISERAAYGIGYRVGLAPEDIPGTVSAFTDIGVFTRFDVEVEGGQKETRYCFTSRGAVLAEMLIRLAAPGPKSEVQAADTSA